MSSSKWQIDLAQSDLRAALQASELPRALYYFGRLIGVVGILTVVPALGMLADVSGLTKLIWFIWLGLVLLRSRSSMAA